MARPTPLATPDPFLDEFARHGLDDEGLEHGDVRDRIRGLADECDICHDLVESLDAALMGAMLDGTGPWGR